MVVVRLDVGVGEGLVQAFDDGLELNVLACDGVREDVANGEVDGLLIEIVPIE